MFRFTYFSLFLVFFSSCSILSDSRNPGSAIKGINLKEAQKIQKENKKKYTNSYNFKMQQEVERRQKEELRKSKFAHKNKG